jgi:hypothetical protein
MTVEDTTGPLPALDPSRAGRYTLGAVLGRGSTATVHRAHDPVTEDAVAVKLFDAVSPAVTDRHRREVQVLTGLRHPGLVALRDSGTAGERLFVVMDLVEGSSLEDALLAAPLAPDAVIELGARLADALAHVHDRGVVHRDVKPANILLDRSGAPRLADFGIARIDGATRLTETGAVVGTAAYMAPEQVRGGAVGPPADVYALGLVLLEALTGMREYPGSAVEAAIARLHRPPVVPTGLPAGLARALRRMTAADPARRPGAAEVAALLGGDQPHDSGEAHTDGDTRRLPVRAAPAGDARGRRPATAARGGAADPRATGRRHRLVLATAVAVLVGGVLGGWALAQPGDRAVAGSAGATPTVPVERAPVAAEPTAPPVAAPAVVLPAVAPAPHTAARPAPAARARPAAPSDAAAPVAEHAQAPDAVAAAPGASGNSGNSGTGGTGAGAPDPGGSDGPGSGGTATDTDKNADADGGTAGGGTNGGTTTGGDAGSGSGNNGGDTDAGPGVDASTGTG